MNIINLSEYLKYIINITTALHYMFLILHVIVFIIFFFHNFPINLLSSFWELWNVLVSLEFSVL